MMPMPSDRRLFTRDKRPVDQRWVRDYCDMLMRIASPMPEDKAKEALLRRAEYVTDMLEAWQIRNLPKDQSS